MIDSHSPPETFIERMGLSAEAEGLPRIAGRIFGFFIIHGGPCSFSELAERLQVSRGSVSTNTRILRELGLIERTSLPGDRQDYYVLAQRPYVRLLEGSIERMRQSITQASQALDQVDSFPDGAAARLQDMQHFYDSAVTATQTLVDELQQGNQK